MVHLHQILQQQSNSEEVFLLLPGVEKTKPIGIIFPFPVGAKKRGGCPWTKSVEMKFKILLIFAVNCKLILRFWSSFTAVLVPVERSGVSAGMSIVEMRMVEVWRFCAAD